MPFADSKDFEDCVQKRMKETGYSRETATKVCGKMKHELEKAKIQQEWLFDPAEILASTRKVKGTFHKAIVDKDGEYITPDAIRKSIPDYMHLPALHDFHKERPVGIATRIWEESDGSFGFEGVIKATTDCDDVWEKIQKGNYDHVSIFGKREAGNQNCSLPQGLRTGPCITSGVRLDSISVCDGNARNDATSLAMAKSKIVVFDGIEMIQKAFPMKERIAPGSHTEKVLGKEITGSANELYDSEQARKKRASDHQANKEAFINESTRKAETAGESNLMHTVTDYPEKKCGCKKELEKGKWGDNEADINTADKHPSKIKTPKKKFRYKVVEKGDDMDEDVEKSEKWSQKEKNEAFDKLEREDPGRAADYRQHESGGEKGKRQYFNKGEDTNEDVNQKPIRVGDKAKRKEPSRGEDYHDGKLEKGDDDVTEETDDVEKGAWAGGEIPELRTKDTHKTTKPKPKEKKHDTSEVSGKSYDKMKEEKQAPVAKAEKEQEIDTETRGKEEEENSEEEDVEKGFLDRVPLSSGKSSHQHAKDYLKEKDMKHSHRMASAIHAGRATDRNTPALDKHDRERGAAGLKRITKSGEQMEDEEVSQEYVTKAMVPIEEVDTIIKARTEEISKAYTAQFEEIKKAYDAKLEDVKKAYDGKLAELNSKVDKMAEETIRKGGNIVVIPELLKESGGSMSNADALARMTAGK